MRAAGRWRNLFDGQITNGRLQYRVPPGRIGNGVPLSGEEVSGHIDIANTRFDITGRLPPMRDAAGSLDFRGNDVDVALTSGATFMPDGQSVTASGGIFTIRNAHLDKVIGTLDLDIAGEASAITQLASYEPIDAMSQTGLTPDQFSGQVTGHVKADIPLIGDVELKELNWLVSLDYEDLALTKPIEGQIVSEAAGNITVDPKQGGDQGQGQAQRCVRRQSISSNRSATAGRSEAATSRWCSTTRPGRNSRRAWACWFKGRSA